MNIQLNDNLVVIDKMRRCCLALISDCLTYVLSCFNEFLNEGQECYRCCCLLPPFDVLRGEVACKDCNTHPLMKFF